VLNGEVLLNLVKSISKALSAEQRGSTLSVLREIVEKWQKETKGVVSFELEATFELVVKSVLGDSLKVPAVSTRCLGQFGWVFCRSVAAVVPGAVEDISGAVVAASAVVAPAVVAPVVVAPVVAPVADDASVSSVLDAVIEEIAVSVSATAATETAPLKPLVKEVVPEQVQPVVNLPTRKASNRLSMKSERRG
jgi:hypothetical protein